MEMVSIQTLSKVYTKDQLLSLARDWRKVEVCYLEDSNNPFLQFKIRMDKSREADIARLNAEDFEKAANL
jgi:hypothetical protein